MKSGEVQTMQTEALFSLHHINAYETKDGSEIVLDLSHTDPFGLRYDILNNNQKMVAITLIISSFLSTDL